MSPKERVRINIYKTLLKEEQQKNKRKSYLTMSVFIIGIFAGSIYNFIPSKETNINNLGEYVNISTYKNLDTKNRNTNDIIDNYFNVNNIQDKTELKTDEYFAINMQS
ncbi:MAG: hypothetical protein MR673_01765 [Fusobacterium perfoetens]|uniref:hypothetical protein n=1 Tax=Fusobacterium perfoetens TaxID=852 RepID=UPI0023EFA520|nr:hypothetical protein [Fusobacterium perfoetens]MCI6151837.1 hypothetical protein [Fusobacterium perfoetens]MDY3236802.1 hypothetical protein [Fusobacterium perfoetens]